LNAWSSPNSARKSVRHQHSDRNDDSLVGGPSDLSILSHCKLSQFDRHFRSGYDAVAEQAAVDDLVVVLELSKSD